MNKTSLPECHFTNELVLMAEQRLSVTATEIMTRVDVIIGVRDDKRPYITAEQQHQSHISVLNIT